MLICLGAHVARVKQKIRAHLFDNSLISYFDLKYNRTENFFIEFFLKYVDYVLLMFVTIHDLLWF